MRIFAKVFGLLALTLTGAGAAFATPLTATVNGPDVAAQYGIPAPMTRGVNPYPVDIFVRGSFNDWGTSDVMTYDADTETYEAVLSLDVGVWEFKIASEDWATVDLGAGDSGDPNVLLDVARTIGSGPFGNLVLEIDAAGLYSFMLLDTIANPDAPTLLVSAVTAIPEPAMPALFGIGLLALVIVARRVSRR